MSAITAPCALILAAGQGRRFQDAAGQGSDKLLAQCSGLDGIERSVIEQVMRNLGDTLERRVLVTRAHKTQVIQLGEAYGCEVVLLDSAGMGDSLRTGVEASLDADGWLVCLGDMPFVTPGTFARVRQCMAPERICVAHGAQGHGHPVGFGRTFREQLLSLQGDQGARRLFAEAHTQRVACADPGIYRDVDRPGDLVG
ncbi:nucleotidyltransferase family protein [Pseudomonas sp. CFBP 13727]|uniref:nucleotidyltransferase family protein n=1 Tax=Pseudomonas sp. CFBP 13727 TaxID=2775295 RepID=UPI00177AF9AC|nr:nucleotidyltransferase family protein [Pseudomonas sp. CFBP 13727]MBD8622340.1 nucleotidyltransferase family protein [Pseudomonas sp. CFBP 13727]